MLRNTLLALVLLGLTSCGPTSKSPTAPSVTTIAPIPGAFLTQVNGVTVWAVHDKSSPNMQRIIYYCDYPMNYYGPPAPGHCYEDGSGCTGSLPGDPGGYTSREMLQCGSADPDISNLKQAGDPTADDARSAGDGDATVVR